MNLTSEQLAELLAGIVRSQQAIIDAVESERAGWRNTHLLPKLNVAANMRLANVRLLDLPSRILLRSQSRVGVDVGYVRELIEAAVGETAAGTTANMGTNTDNVPEAGQASQATPATAARPSASPASAPVNYPGEIDLGNFFDD